MENKLQPGKAGPGNMLGCSLVLFHFLWALLCPQAVVYPSAMIPILRADFAQPCAEAVGSRIEEKARLGYRPTASATPPYHRASLAWRNAEFLALKHESRILRHSSNPLSGFSMMEQGRDSIALKNITKNITKIITKKLHIKKLQ